MTDDTSNNDQSQSNTNTTPPQPPLLARVTALVNAGKLNAMAWFIRMYIVVLSVQHIFLGGAFPSIEPCYKKALIANALVACIRLHQRIGGQFALSKEHFARVCLEDSAHYLLFSVIFLMQPGKITMALFPVSLMALVHAVKYGFQVLDCAGTNTGRGVLNAIALKQQTIFRAVALIEICLLPVLTIMLVIGRAQLFSPFLYYKYVKLRYFSQRNGYCRQVFWELKQVGNQYKNSDRIPAFVKKAIQMVQDTCDKMGTPPAAQPAQ